MLQFYWLNSHDGRGVDPSSSKDVVRTYVDTDVLSLSYQNGAFSLDGYRSSRTLGSWVKVGKDSICRSQAISTRGRSGRSRFDLREYHCDISDQTQLNEVQSGRYLLTCSTSSMTWDVLVPNLIARVHAHAELTQWMLAIKPRVLVHGASSITFWWSRCID